MAAAVLALPILSHASLHRDGERLQRRIWQRGLNEEIFVILAGCVFGDDALHESV